MMKMPLVVVLMVLPVLAGSVGCATVPDDPVRQKLLVDESKEMLDAMQRRDPGLEPMIERSAGYAVFPSCGKAGFVFGGGFGRGSVFDNTGAFQGYAKVTQASVGGIIGGRSFALLLVFDQPEHLERFMFGDEVNLGAEAGVVAIDKSRGKTVPFRDGVAVFTMPRGGLMADASVSTQKFAFVRRAAEPKGPIRWAEPPTASVPRD